MKGMLVWWLQHAGRRRDPGNGWTGGQGPDDAGRLHIFRLFLNINRKTLKDVNLGSTMIELELLKVSSKTLGN